MGDEKLLNYYQANFQKFGVHENSLGWTKGKQNVRFHQLTRHFDLSNRSVVDIGCGFGDLLQFFKLRDVKYKGYLGIDIVPEFIDVSKNKHGSDSQRFVLGNYMELDGIQTDVTVASGIFGHRLFDSEEKQYEYVQKVFERAFAASTQGISFDFISDRVEFKSSTEDFFANPEKILKIAYGLSRRVVLDNTALPFEFSITVLKDQSFETSKTVFSSFLDKHPDLMTQK